MSALLTEAGAGCDDQNHDRNKEQIEQSHAVIFAWRIAAQVKKI